MKLILLILSLISFNAQARMGGGELGPPAPPSFPPCDVGATNACHDREAAMRDDFHARSHALDPQIASLENQLSQASRDKAAAVEKDEDLAKEATAIEDEISFLNRGDAPLAKEIIPGFASAEDYFGLSADDRSWHDLYPEFRASMLNNRQAEVRTLKSDSAAVLQKITTNFSSLNDQYQSLKSQRDQYNAEAQVHETRSGTECRQLFCPGH